MLIPDSPQWNDIFSSETPWSVINVPACSSQMAHEFAVLMFADLGFAPRLNTSAPTTASLADHLRDRIEGPTCFLLEPGVHEIPATELASEYPIIFKALAEPKVGEGPCVVITSGCKGSPMVSVSSPGGVLMDGVGFSSSSIGGCVEVSSGPCQFSNCHFRAGSKADGVSAVSVSHYVSFRHCTFDMGAVAVAVGGPVDSVIEVRVEDSLFSSKRLVDGVTSFGCAKLMLSNLSVTDISGSAVVSSGSTSGYIKDSAIADTEGTGIIIECLSTLWVKQCTLERCSGASNSSHLKRQVVPTEHQRLTAGGVIVSGRAAPTILGCSFRDNYLIRGSSATPSLAVYVWPMSRTQLLFCGGSSPRVSQNLISGVVLSENDVGVDAHSDYSQPSSCLIAVCETSAPLIDTNDMRCCSESERAIVLGGESAAQVKGNTISRTVRAGCARLHNGGYYMIRLGPSQKSRCSSNTLTGLDSDGLNFPASAIYGAFDTEADIVSGYHEDRLRVPEGSLGPPANDYTSPQESLGGEQVSKTPSRVPHEARPPGSTKKKLLTNSPRQSSALRGRVAAGRNLICPRPLSSCTTPRPPSSGRRSPVSDDKAAAEYERTVALLKVEIAQLRARLRGQSTTERPQSTSKLSVRGNRAPEPFLNAVRVGDYVWDYSKLKAFNKQEVPLSEVRRRVGEPTDGGARDWEGSSIDATIPRRLHDDWLIQQKRLAEERAEAVLTTQRQVRRLTAEEQRDLVYRMHDESCADHEEALERVREQVVREERDNRPCALPLTVEEIQEVNHRMYYENIQNRSELRETLRRRYGDGGFEEEGAHGKFPKLIRTTSDILAYSDSLHRGHRDPDSARKAAAVIYPGNGDSGRKIFVRREKTHAELYPSLQRRLLVRSKSELEAYSASLFSGEKERPPTAPRPPEEKR